jgi:hypothetical protein
MNNQENPNESHQEQRREFIKTATKLSGIVALLGISTESFGAIISPSEAQDQSSDPRVQAIQLIFTEAMDSGDMRGAIDRHRRESRLTDDQVKALMSISREELAALRSLRGKLMPLRLSDLTLMSRPNSGAGPTSGPVPPYGEAIRKAIARGDLQEMRNTSANARRWVADVNSALAQLESSMKKVGG